MKGKNTLLPTDVNSHDSARGNGKKITGVTQHAEKTDKATIPVMGPKPIHLAISIPLIERYLGYLRRERLIVKLVSHTTARMHLLTLSRIAIVYITSSRPFTPGARND